MFTKFISLEWKAFTRASSFTSNVVMKIFMIIAAIYFTIIFLSLGFFGFDIIEETGQDPLVIISKFMIYYMLMDLLLRIFLQKIPVMNIRPLLTLPIKRSTIVHFAIGKTVLSFFNFLHYFLFVPFAVRLVAEGYDTLNVLFWWLGVTALIYCNNFLNILANNKDWVFMVILGVFAGIAGLQYYQVFDITIVTSIFYHGFYATYYMFLIPVAVLAGLWVATFRYFRNALYLDTGLKGKHDIAETQDYTWLNRFGTMGTFLKNDIKLIRRNKRSKTTVIMSFLFLFYGLLFMTGAIEAYDNDFWKVFAGIFVSGGFLFTFGQFVPSWDSAYYPLMMSQNITYKDYIASKWWLIVIATLVSTVLASFYLYFGVDTYLIIVAGAVYNIGINSYLVLFGGAFIKTPIDLASSKQAFGDKKAFNMKTMLLTIPKLLLPIAFYIIGDAIGGPTVGYAVLAGSGILGFAFRNFMFGQVEKIYKLEKYKTLDAYKQKS
ncbi:DUF5687 family protein [Flavobacterium sp. MFBS3-15]|uniref:DUF5687 family protein n=1 Tax=Flavobacterium sp. MFBS3-15 TaxID=2989816 RepID=UPI002235F7F1|nr:DUF5687 family protein [Flavobacterium sp. MFBS3-15]MCW4469200.1 DUF5687 family protein [Flavobacterium sp. MFBS3-15]